MILLKPSFSLKFARFKTRSNHVEDCVKASGVIAVSVRVSARRLPEFYTRQAPFSLAPRPGMFADEIRSYFYT